MFVERDLDRPEYREQATARFRELRLPVIYESKEFRVISLRPLMESRAAD